MEKFKILAGLPVYGDLPEQFSATGMGMHREGFVVQFFPSENRASWVGNFQRGLNFFDEALEHPDGSSNKSLDVRAKQRLSFSVVR